MKNLTFIFIISILLISCSKENSDVFVPYPNDPLNDTTWSAQPAATASVNKISDVIAIAPKLDSFEVTNQTTIHTADVLDVVYPQGFCKYPNGTAVSGKVKVEVTYLRKKGDFIRFVKPTTSYGRVLETGGSFFIRVTKEGQELVLDPTKAITLRIREDNPATNMKVFYGEQNLVAPLPVGTNPNFTWAQSTDNSSVNIFTRQDSTGTYKGYEVSAKKLNWVSINNFTDSTLAKTRISAILPANFTNNNTMVFAVFKEQRTVVQFNSEVSSRSFFATNIPLAKKVTIISITKIGDDLYAATKDVTIESNMRISLNPEKKTKAQLDTILDAL